MHKEFKIFSVFIMFFGFLINILAQDQQSLDGIWRSKTTGYLEELGNYEINQILIIQNSKYTHIYEIISQKVTKWSTCERGLLVINNNEIIFFQEEYTNDKLNLLWEINENKIFICNYNINNNILTITKEDEVIKYLKE
jgi:hypothetical protein